MTDYDRHNKHGQGAYGISKEHADDAFGSHDEGGFSGRLFDDDDDDSYDIDLPDDLEDEYEDDYEGSLEASSGGNLLDNLEDEPRSKPKNNHRGSSGGNLKIGPTNVAENDSDDDSTESFRVIQQAHGEFDRVAESEEVASFDTVEAARRELDDVPAAQSALGTVSASRQAADRADSRSNAASSRMPASPRDSQSNAASSRMPASPRDSRSNAASSRMPASPRDSRSGDAKPQNARQNVGMSQASWQGFSHSAISDGWGDRRTWSYKMDEDGWPAEDAGNDVTAQGAVTWAGTVSTDTPAAHMETAPAEDDWTNIVGETFDSDYTGQFDEGSETEDAGTEGGRFKGAGSENRDFQGTDDDGFEDIENDESDESAGIEDDESYGEEADDDIYFMQLAIEQANKALDIDEVPIGAVVVYDGEVIASASNRREIDADPAAHAEFLAIEEAAAHLKRWRLTGCTVYVTLEPCIMCAGLMHQARIDRCVYGASDPKAGALGTLYDIASDTRLNHNFEVTSGVLRDECAQMLKDFFADRR